jgi:hypothetical protein
MTNNETTANSKVLLELESEARIGKNNGGWRLGQRTKNLLDNYELIEREKSMKEEIKERLNNLYGASKIQLIIDKHDYN